MEKTFKIATPISELLNSESFCKEIINISDLLELRDSNIKIEDGCPSIYHSELNILSEWNESEIALLNEKNKNHRINFVSYHLSSRYKENKIKKNAFIGIGKPYSISEMRDNIEKNIKISKEIFGHDKPILVENNNYFPTSAYEIITEAEFILELIEDFNLYLLLDIAHAKITAHNKGIDFKQYIKKLPLDRCKQIHLSRATFIDTLGIDSHEALEKEDWNEFKEILNNIENLEVVTIEYYKNVNILLALLNNLKSIQEERLINNIFKIAEWDSEYFGFKVARLEAEYFNSDILNKCIQIAKKESIKCIYCLSDSTKENILIEAGFEKLVEKVEYSRKSEKSENFEKFNIEDAKVGELNIKDLKIEEFKKKDIPNIKEIASRAYRGLSRFYRDEHFNKKKIDELYEKWIDNLVNDKDSTILILRKNGKIIGFNGISFKERVGRIELIAVSEKYYNQGYGSLLVKFAQDYFNNINLTKKNLIIEGSRIYLRPLTEDDANEKYRSWINDPDVNKFLDAKSATIDSLKEYIKEKYNDPNCLFLGIFRRDKNNHIGNVKLDLIDLNKKKARFGLLIGEKRYWNRGFGAETFKILVDFTFKNLNLDEIDSGVYKQDIVTIKFLEKCGFNANMKVATQGENEAANYLYRKMGFEDKERKFWFHWWNEGI